MDGIGGTENERKRTFTDRFSSEVMAMLME
jgi:hypothetical protein